MGQYVLPPIGAQVLVHKLRLGFHLGYLFWKKLDFNFLVDIEFSTQPPRSEALFAGGSTATKDRFRLNQVSSSSFLAGAIGT